MVNYYSADYILPVSDKPIPKGVVGVDAGGTITGVYYPNAKEIQHEDIKEYRGIITLDL